MKKFLLFILFAPSVQIFFAQDGENPLPFVHVEPEYDKAALFPGGLGAMLKFFADSIHYPEPEKTKNIQGNISVRFEVTTEGKLINIEPLNGVPGGPNLSIEAIRLIQSMPAWLPASKNGKSVASENFLSVPFIINKETNIEKIFHHGKIYSSSNELKLLREEVINAQDDSVRLKANDHFIIALEKILQSEESFKMDFDSLRQTGILHSPDNAFRMITWNLPLNDETHKYYCYIILKQSTDYKSVQQKKKKKYQFFKLIDKSDEIQFPEKKTLGKENWYGALYYQIIPFSNKGKTYYTLLGWDGNSSITRKKIIDVFYFANNGEPKFGEDIFQMGKTTLKRVIFEFSSQAVMSLKYHPGRKQIVFDHLSPSQPEMAGMYQYYGPDFSYDAFEWEKGKWVYKEDVDIRLETENPIYNPEIKNNESPIYSPKK